MTERSRTPPSELTPEKARPSRLSRILSSLFNSRWLQGVLIALLTLILALGLLYWSIVPLLNNWLPPVLDRFVAPGSHIVIRSLTRQHFEVDELDLQPAEGVLIQIRNARLTYHGASLLLGEADSLSAESLKVVITSDDAKGSGTNAASSSSNKPSAVELPLVSDLMTLPVASITVDHVEIDTPDISARLNAVLTPDHWLLTGDAKLPQLQEKVAVNAQLQRSPNKELAGRSDFLLMLSQQERLLAQLWAGIHQTDESTSAQIRIEGDLDAMQAALPVLADIPLQGHKLLTEGTLSAANTAYWPQDLRANLNTSLSTRKSRISDILTVEKSALKLSVNQTEAGKGWAIKAQLEPLQANVLMAATADFPESTWTVSAKQQSLSAQCDAAIEVCDVSADLKAAIDGLTHSSLSLTPSGHWEAYGNSSLTLPLSMSYQQDALQGLPAWAMDGKGEFKATLNADGHWQLTSAQGLVFDATVDEYQGWKVTPVKATVLAGLKASGGLDDVRMITTDPLHLTINNITATSAADEATLRLAPSRVSCNPGEIDTLDAANAILANCDVSLRLNDSDWGLWPIPDVSLNGPVAITMDEIRERVTASLNLNAANGEIRFRTRAEHDLKTSKGSLQWHLTDARLDWFALGLSKMANLTSVQLLNGHMSGQGWVDWEDNNGEMNITPDLMLRADGLGLIYDNTITLEEWNAMLALRRPQNGDYLLDAQVSGSKLDSGIPLTNILARTQTRIPSDFSYFEVAVHEIHTDLLGGRIYAPLIQYDSRKEINSFGVRLDHLQLSQIAAIEESAGIKATGLLDGMLPIVITKEGPMVPGGNLFARDPGGVVKYQDESADALAQADQSVGLAMQLLQNFHYKKLQSGVRYQPDGQLNLSLQFQGKNPDFFDGQATNLNVNLEYNLLDLLESLRIANDVIEKVESKYK